jgi:chemotaxis protein CheX
MVGEKHQKITPELEDAAGELLNMIFGQAKTVLNDQKGYTLDRALPTILSGEKLSLRHQGHATAIILPFESAVGSFHIEVFVEKS